MPHRAYCERRVSTPWSFRTVPSQVRQPPPSGGILTVGILWTPGRSSHIRCMISAKMEIIQCKEIILYNRGLDLLCRLSRAIEHRGFPTVHVAVSEKMLWGVTPAFHLSRYQFSSCHCLCIYHAARQMCLRFVYFTQKRVALLPEPEPPMTRMLLLRLVFLVSILM